MGEALQRVLSDIVGTQAAPRAALIWLAGLLALAVIAAPTGWSIARHVVTIAHEGAHAVAAVLAGRRLAGIRVHSDSSGLTISHGRPQGLGVLVMLLAGYVGPGLVGLGAAYLLHRGHALGVLWAVVLLLALLLVQIRNFHGLWAVLVSGLAVFAVSWWGSASVQSFAAYAGTWFLLLAAVRTVLELQISRHRGRAPTSDADQLARLTRVPGIVWVGVFLLVDLGALVLGGRLILAPMG